ncbi:molybdenum cofactor guanylyltransferase [Anatilimnocola sp. NA78]|uniref:molybdenum cofactor guanylyltransferase n=1 Tax=Anatilimnocola sp. NA78 TaxID=3415683 RepID=UPI003CE4ED11
MRAGGIILCGGKSSRMGLPKATLPFGPEFMLQRVHRLLSEVVQPIVVVSAVEQPLPMLPAETLFASDERPDRGPLEALCAGLKTIQPYCDLAYVTSCDVPLLQPSFVRQLLALAGDFAAVAPQEETFCHPLSAVYRTSLVPTIKAMLASDQLRPNALLKQIQTLFIPIEELRASDPSLLTLRNLNRPEDYFAALKDAGFELDPVIKAGLRAE